MDHLDFFITGSNLESGTFTWELPESIQETLEKLKVLPPKQHAELLQKIKADLSELVLWYLRVIAVPVCAPGTLLEVQERLDSLIASATQSSQRIFDE